jgi:hypothetical protein
VDAVARTVDDAALKTASTDLGAKLLEAEMELVDLRQTGQGQDGVRFGSKLISKMGYLSNGMAAATIVQPTSTMKSAPCSANSCERAYSASTRCWGPSSIG